MPYYYTAYGLSFSSTLELPELTSFQMPNQSILPDIEIAEGEIEFSFDDQVIVGPFFQASKTNCILTTPDGNRYWLHLGKKLIISRKGTSPDETVRHFLIYGALPILLIQRGLFLLHGSAVSNGNSALVLLGTSLSGKSTLVAGFWQMGWQLVSDEIVVCTLDRAQRVCAQPGIPQILLWQNAIEKLELDSNLPRLSRVPNQFILSVGDQFGNKAMPIQAAFYLERLLKDSFTMDAHGQKKFSCFMQNAYLPQLPRPTSINVIQAKVPMLLAAKIPLEIIFWSSQQYRVKDLLAKILERVE